MLFFSWPLIQIYYSTHVLFGFFSHVIKLHREKAWQREGEGRADKRTCNFSEHFISLPLSPLCFDKMKQD